MFIEVVWLQSFGEMASFRPANSTVMENRRHSLQQNQRRNHQPAAQPASKMPHPMIGERFPGIDGHIKSDLPIGWYPHPHKATSRATLSIIILGLSSCPMVSSIYFHDIYFIYPLYWLDYPTFSFFCRL